MASVTVSGSSIDIVFTDFERPWVGREMLSVPISAVRHFELVDRPLRLACGGRRGLVVSGFIKIGIWGVLRGPRQLVVARRGEPGLHLILDREAAGVEFDEVVLSDHDAPRLAGVMEDR